MTSVNLRRRLLMTSTVRGASATVYIFRDSEDLEKERINSRIDSYAPSQCEK